MGRGWGCGLCGNIWLIWCQLVILVRIAGQLKVMQQGVSHALPRRFANVPPRSPSLNTRAPAAPHPRAKHPTAYHPPSIKKPSPAPRPKQQQQVTHPLQVLLPRRLFLGQPLFFFGSSGCLGPRRLRCCLRCALLLQPGGLVPEVLVPLVFWEGQLQGGRGQWGLNLGDGRGGGLETLNVGA